MYILAIGAALYLYLASRKESGVTGNYQLSDTGDHGTAGFQNEEEKKRTMRLSLLQDTSKEIIGTTEDERLVYTYDPSKMPSQYQLHYLSNEHKAVVATSGKGKSYSLAAPDLFQAILRGDSIIATDPKGQLFSQMAAIAREYGYDVKLLNLKNPKCSDGCNYLSVIKGETLNAQRLANTIIENTKEGNRLDEWDKVAGYLLTATILYFTAEKAEFNPLTENMSAINDFIKLELEVLEEQFIVLPDKHPAKRAVMAFFGASENYKRNAQFSLIRKLQVFDDNAIRDMTTYNDIDFEAPGKRKCAYFICTPDQESTMDFLAAMAFSCFFHSLVEYADNRDDQCLPVRVKMILDEFPNIATISDFTKKLATVRSRRIDITMIFQDLGQLMRKYPDEEWASIMDACQTKIFLGSSDVENTLPYIEKLLGKTTIDTESQNLNRSRFLPGQKQLKTRYDEKIGTSERSLLTVDELRRLDERHLIAVLGNQKPVILKKFGRHMHPLNDIFGPTNPNKHIPIYKQNPMWNGSDAYCRFTNDGYHEGNGTEGYYSNTSYNQTGDGAQQYQTEGDIYQYQNVHRQQDFTNNQRKTQNRRNSMPSQKDIRKAEEEELRKARENSERSILNEDDAFFKDEDISDF